MVPIPRHVYEFGPFTLDPSERRLTRDGTPVPLTPKVFDLLVLLVERRGRLLAKDVLIKTLWPESYVEEANLTVNMSSLRRALGEPPNGSEYIETVPRRGYRFVAEVRERQIGEETSAQPSASADQPEPRAPKEGKSRTRAPWLVLGTAALLLAVVLIGVLRPPGKAGSRRVGAAADIRTLAILPFLPLDESRDADSLGLGMTDALITKLSNLRQISVRPTSSVLRYGKSNRDALMAGRELGVDGLIEGRVQHSGAAIRVTVQLLSVREGVPLWADRFDDELSNVFAVQDSISERMAIALSLTLSGNERRLLTKRFTENASAYEDYEMGRFYLLHGSIDAATRAIDYFEQAIAKDASYGAAYAGLATARITTASGNRPQDYREAAKQAAEALRLDPDLPDAHLAIGWVAMFSRWDWQGAERSFRRAIEINRTEPIPHLALSTVLTARRRHDEAIREMKLAKELDPASVLLIRNLAWTYLQARNYDSAETWGRKATEMDPADANGHRELARALLKQGRHDGAIAELKKAMSLGGNVGVELARAYTVAGRPAEAGGALTGSSGEKPSFELALLHASRGETDLAFAELDRAVREQSGRIPWLSSDPDLDVLRRDPRFAGLLRRVNLEDAGGRDRAAVK